ALLVATSGIWMGGWTTGTTCPVLRQRNAPDLQVDFASGKSFAALRRQPVCDVLGKGKFPTAVGQGKHGHRQVTTRKRLPERVHRGIPQGLAKIILADHGAVA